MIQCILLELSSKFQKFRLKNGVSGVYLHMDNAPYHNSQITSQKINDLQMKRLDHPAYSPDITMCDFLLFGKTKDHLKGKCLSTEKEHFDEVRQLFKSIKNLKFKLCTKNGFGDYIL